MSARADISTCTTTASGCTSNTGPQPLAEGVLPQREHLCSHGNLGEVGDPALVTHTHATAADAEEYEPDVGLFW